MGEINGYVKQFLNTYVSHCRNIFKYLPGFDIFTVFYLPATLIRADLYNVHSKQVVYFFMHHFSQVCKFITYLLIFS